MRPLRSFVRIVAAVFVLSALSFVLLHAMPGSVEEQILRQNPNLTVEEIDRIRSLSGLDRPVYARFSCWWIGRHQSVCDWWPGGDGLLAGDLGWSDVHKEPVVDLLARRSKTTLSLMIPAFLIALLIAVPLGAWSAHRRSQGFDKAARWLTYLGLAMPSHWVALLFVFVFAVSLGWFPASGVSSIDDDGFGSRIVHAVLPVSVLVVVFVSRWSRFVREATLEALGDDYVVTARAKGLSPERVLWGHAVPNALFPLITLVTQSLPLLFSGALIVERVFAYPGVGLLIFESVNENDHLVAMVVFLVYATVTMLSMSLADLLYRAADPRVQS